MINKFRIRQFHDKYYLELDKGIGEGYQTIFKHRDINIIKQMILQNMESLKDKIADEGTVVFNAEVDVPAIH